MDEKNILVRESAEDLRNDLIKFPPLLNYINGLNELASMNLGNESYEEIGRLFYERAILFQQTFGTNSKDKFNQRVFYRVRMNIGVEEDPNLVRTYSYPSPCKSRGRANLEGKSVFYCSDHAGSALSESKPVENQIGYLSVWEPKAERNVKYGICLPENLRTENKYKLMANDIYKFITDNSKQCAGEKAAHFQFYHHFVAERFIKESYPYPLTSWIANEMLYGPHWRDFIIYPSVSNEFYSCNKAFHPNSADTLLKFKKVLKFRVEGYQGRNIAITEMSVGELEHSKMKWRKPSENELTIMMPGGKYT